MNFDKESKSEDFFLGGGWGWGEWEERGEEGDFNRKKKLTKNNRYTLIFCAHALYKISSS